MSQEIQRTLGRIEGKLDGIQATQKEHTESINSMDDRLRTVETRSVTNGAVAGVVAGTGVSILAMKIKSVLGI